MKVVIILIILVFAFAWAKQNMAISKICKGKTEEQKKVIKYLFGGVLVFGKMTDQQYDQLINDKLNSLNLKAKALAKIGLDEDQVNEIAPVNFQGFDCSANVRKADTYAIYTGKDNKLRSTQYESVWLFFSDSQVYMYKYHFDMCSDNKRESTEEYFYRDVTNFATQQDTVSVTVYKQGWSGKKEAKVVNKDYSTFSLVVPGDKFYCSTTNTEDVDQSISGMKQKLREKKNA